MKGRFITVEGGEGAGKSTQVERIGAWLAGRGYTVIHTREPGGTRLAEQIRATLLDAGNATVSELTELLLMFAARAQHLDELIRPALARGECVLCDRFTDATWAYQGGGRGLPSESIAALENLVHGDLQPELTLLLDLPVSLGLERIARRGEADRFEREPKAFFERVRRSYLERAAAEPRRFVVIDASPGPEEVWARIEQVLQERIGR